MLDQQGHERAIAPERLGGLRVLQRLDDELWKRHEGAGEDQRRTQEARQPIVVEVVERQTNEGDEDAAANDEEAFPLGSASSDRGVGGHGVMMPYLRRT